MTENNWAIVVGINQYEHLPADDHLKYAVKDALAMQSFLCDRAQFPADNVLVCCDPQVAGTRRPSRSGLRDLLRHKLQPARGADNFWFFYAGHGVVHNSQDFLLPCDGNPYDLEETALPISFVTDCLRDCEAHNVVLVLDMCRNRTRDATEEGMRSIETGVVTPMGEQTLELAKAQGLVTLFSCSRGQRSYEIADLEQGAFTHTLLAGLRESTTPRVLEQYLTNQVPVLNRQYGKPAQVPLVVPEPGWKYDRPLLLSAATLFDLSLLATQARDAELDEDYDLAESLWWQVIEVERSTLSDRATAGRALKRLGGKRRGQSQPQPPTQPQPQPEPRQNQHPQPVLETESQSSQVAPSPAQRPTKKPPVFPNASSQNLDTKSSRKDFFISYNKHDKQWAEWLAWTLEEAGYTVVIQAWDFQPGGNFVQYMDKAVKEAKQTLAVLSEHFLQANYTHPEWAAAFARDPQGLQRTLLPVRVGECEPEGLLAQIVSVDLVGVPEVEAKQRLLNALQERAKPAQPPGFPGAVTADARTEPVRVPFPGERPTTPGLQPVEFDVVTVNAEGQKSSRKRGQAQYFTEDLGNGVELEMVSIPGGRFLMGSPAREGADDEKPQHSVTVPPFFMSQHPVTQEQWRVVAALPKLKCDLQPNPSNFKGVKRPVEQVNWWEAVEFCDRLARQTGRQYRLPSEAEWEYACRAGTTTPYHFGERLTAELANYNLNCQQTTDVGSFPPNTFGLYDMHGNVWEWCADHWHGNYEGAPTDGSAWVTGGNSEHRLLRGGSWGGIPGHCRSACRDGYPRGSRYGYVGFRVCCVLPRSLLSP